MPISVPNFNFLTLLVSEINRGVPKFNVGLLAPCRTPKLLRVLQVYLARSNSLPTFSIVALCIMQSCDYVFAIGLPLYVPKNGVLGSFESKDVEILYSNPQNTLPCVKTRLMVYRMSKSVQRPEL